MPTAWSYGNILSYLLSDDSTLCQISIKLTIPVPLLEEEAGDFWLLRELGSVFPSNKSFIDYLIQTD